MKIRPRKRYAFTRLHDLGAVDRSYRVNRPAGRRTVLGVIHHRGPGNDSWEIECDNPAWNGRVCGGMGAAVEALDLADLDGRVCACGKAVIEHDFATRSAMRYWADYHKAAPEDRRRAAHIAFANGVAGQESDQAEADAAVAHAEAFAMPHTPGSTLMIKVVGGEVVASEVVGSRRVADAAARGFVCAFSWKF